MNNCSFTGRLVVDPELMETGTGTKYTRFTIAVNRMRKDDPADFIRCIAWKQSAEFLSQYSKKADVIGVTGEMRTGKYEKDGQTHYTCECWCNRVEILHEYKPKADYPNTGSSLKREDIKTDSNDIDDILDPEAVPW
jgi:single-strand DNA-binding protein